MTKSHGSGEFSGEQFARLEENVVFENGVLVFHPENIEIGKDVYIGHYTILKGYYKNRMVIGDGTWIGQQCFFHSGGGLTIGRNVGVGPGVKILTSSHAVDETDKPILLSTIRFAPVVIGDDCDLGAGAIILPGVRIGRGVQVGAGAVVASDIGDYAIAAGVPARALRMRK
jgi:acetyltransferase-like isoleucine patch superfamily enzyme